MPPTNRGSIAALLAPDLHKVFFETGKERPLEHPYWINVGEMPYNPMTDQAVAGLGTMPSKNEGASFSLDELMIGGTKTYTASAWGMACEITWEAYRDELYGALQEMVRGMQKAARYRQEVQAHLLLNNAFTSGTGFDSTYLCSTSHTKIDGSTWGNRPSVDIGLSLAGIQAMSTAFENLTDERGLPRLMAASMLIIHHSKKFIAREIFGSGGKPYTAQNEINAILDEDLKYFCSHYLTSTTAWFGHVPKSDHDVNMYWRDYPIFDCFDDPRTKNAVATAYQRFATGFGSAYGWWGTTG